MLLQKLKYFFILAAAVFIVGCNNSPVLGPQEQLIKTQTKWLVDNKTENKIAKVFYKEFDRLGNMTQEEEYNSTGSLLVRKELSITGSIQIEDIVKFGENGEIVRSRNVYSLNEQGNVIERLTISGSGDTTLISKFTYYDNGKIKSEIEFNANGDLVKKTNYMYNYNENGYITGRLINDSPDASYKQRDSIVYHLNLNQVEHIIFDTEGAKEIVYIFYYNNLGNVLKEVQTDNVGIVQRKYLYEYTFY